MVVCSLLFSSSAQAIEEAGTLQLSDSNSIDRRQVTSEPFSATVQNLLQLALDQDGVPYHRGGANPEKGFDCSGFVRYVFDQIEGVILPHSAAAISKLGTHIKMAELQPGDLLFFHTVRHTISHVGIYLGNNRFIHASSHHTGGVRISSLTDGYWARRFTIARRLDFPSGHSPNSPE